MSEKRSVLEQIAQDARHLRKARMLPNDRPLTPDEIDAVARAAKLWMAESRLSQKSVARMLGKGFGDSTISNFINGVKRGDLEKVARAVNELMERHASAAEIARPNGFVEIEVARRMLTVIKTAIDTGRMGEIIGPSGVGKTMTLKAAHSMYSGSVYLRIHPQSQSAMGFTRELAQTLGVTFRSDNTQVVHKVIEHLKGTRRPILLDELNLAREGALEVVRALHDGTGCPVILCGTEILAKAIADRSRWFGQFNRRIVARFDIGEWLATSPSRGRRVFSPAEIMEIFASERLRLTDDGAEFLSGIACLPNEGGIGLVEMIVMVAGRLSKIQGKPVTAKILMAVLREMHGGAYVNLVQQSAERHNIHLSAGVA